MSSSDDLTSPPFYQVSDDNHAGLVVVAAVVFLIYAILGVGAKLVIRLNIASVKAHDTILIGGIVLYFVETVCIIVACNNGLGQHQDAISKEDINLSSKLNYTAHILGLFVEACTKISICLLTRQINQKGLFNTANMALGVIIVAWTVSGLFALLFQCHLPTPWLAVSKEQCPSRGPIYMYNGVMNILTDLALCALPVAMMWEVQTTMRRKVIVVALFGTRIIVPVVTIPGLAQNGYLFTDYSDFTWRVVPGLVWFQISLGLSVLTACIPSLKGVVDSLLGSTAVAAVQAPYDVHDNNKGTGIELTPLPGGRYTSDSFKLSSKVSSKSRNINTNWTASRNATASHNPNSPGLSDGGGESVRGLTEGVVHVRDDFEVRYEDNKGSSISGDDSQDSSIEYHQHV